MWDDRQTQIVDTLCTDGIAAYPGLVSPERCATLLEAVGRSRLAPSGHYRCLSPVGAPRLESDLFRWRDIPEIRSLVTDPALVEVAGAYLGTDDPVVLEDQWFWSQEGSATESPWHQDEPYHPLDRPFLTVWIPLTPVPPGLGLRGVVGSHEREVYAPIEFSAQERTLSEENISLDPVPDVDADPVTYRVVDPAGGVGDAVLLDSRTLHAAGGPCTADFVRLSIRYAHPDTARRGRPWPTATFWEEWHWTDGDRLPAAGFPRTSALVTLAESA
ncbi:MAG: phytanoyl-CoA dioxygenase family protein [Nocardioides sp.]|uniref:phytanoyl-CoA dioxygenase family protein n=1 Tax=Nocardioides sp. TaxID=35761 RepID=UPI0039E46AB3